MITNKNRDKYHNFTWGKFKDLEDLPEHIEDRLTTLKQLNERIADIYSRLPAYTTFIVSSCSGDTREWKKYVLTFMRTFLSIH